MKNIVTNIVILALIIISSIIAGIVINKYVIEHSFNLISLQSGNNLEERVHLLLNTLKKYMMSYCSLILTSFVIQIISFFLVYNYYVQVREQTYDPNKSCNN